jgi:hypothetical protein
MSLNSTRLRPLSSDSRTSNGGYKLDKNQKQKGVSDIKVVDLESIESLTAEKKMSSELFNLENHKFYLQTSQKKADVNDRKTIDEIEEELVNKLF